MANVITPQKGSIGNTEFINSEVVASGQPGADYPVSSAGIAAAIGAATAAATTTTLGLVKQSVNIADVTGDNPTAAEFNALLAALIAAGIMAAAEEDAGE